MRMERIFLSVLLLFLCIYTRAQEKSTGVPYGNYIGFGGGYTQISVNEKLNTSVPYTGGCTGTIAEGLLGTGKNHFHIKNSFSFGDLTPYKSAVLYKNTVSSYSENLSIAYYWRAYQNQSQNMYLFAGPLTDALFNIRFNNGELGNSAMSYESALSVALAAKAVKYFNLFATGENRFKRFKVEASVSLPIISKVFTPNYLGISETAVTEKFALIDWSSNYTGYFSNYFNIKTGLSLTYFLKNRNAIELGYYRNYLSTKPEYNPAKTLSSMIVLKLMFNLK